MYRSVHDLFWQHATGRRGLNTIRTNCLGVYLAGITTHRSISGGFFSLEVTHRSISGFHQLDHDTRPFLAVHELTRNQGDCFGNPSDESVRLHFFLSPSTGTPSRTPFPSLELQWYSLGTEHQCCHEVSRRVGFGVAGGCGRRTQESTAVD